MLWTESKRLAEGLFGGFTRGCYTKSGVCRQEKAQRGRAATNESFFPVGAIVGAAFGGLAGWFWVRLPYFLAAGAVVVVLIIQLNTLRKARAGERTAKSSG